MALWIEESWSFWIFIAAQFGSSDCIARKWKKIVSKAKSE